MTHNVVIGLETFSLELAEEIRPLGQKCWDESTAIKGETCAFYGERDFVIDPDLDQYLMFAKQNVLLIVTLRDEGRLHGYAMGLFYKSPHYRNITAGGGDSLYIDPDYRSYTGTVIEKFENELKSRGAAIIGWPTHVNSPLHAVLKARGYVGDDVVMEKKLCAL